MKHVNLRFEAPSTSLRQLLLGHAPGRFTPAVLFGLAAAFVWCAAVASQAWRASGELAQARASLAALQTQKAQRIKAAESARPQLTAPQRQGWGQVARQLNTPWAALLDALEASLPDDVALVLIEPDTHGDSVRLEVEARTLDTLLAYATALGGLPLVEGISLVKHETNDRDNNRPLRLSVDLQIKRLPPASPRAGEDIAR